jgi:hypothetical protein
MKFCAVVFILFSQFCFASKSAELAPKGKLFWEAFVCHHLAIDANETKEAERLLNVAMREGKIFIDSARKGLIEKKDADKIVPMIVIWHLSKQSTDFILGKVYMEAKEEAIKSAFGTKEEYLKRYFDKLYIQTMAGAELRKRNAWLIK